MLRQEHQWDRKLALQRPELDLYWESLAPSSYQQALLLNPTAGATANSGNLSTWWDSSSWYNALTVKVDKTIEPRVSSGGIVSLGARVSTIHRAAAQAIITLFSLQNPPWYDLSLVKGLSDFNIGKSLVINGLWDVPTTKTLGVVGERVLGGWQLGVITKLNDGIPIYPAHR